MMTKKNIKKKMINQMFGLRIPSGSHCVNARAAVSASGRITTDGSNG